MCLGEVHEKFEVYRGEGVGYCWRQLRDEHAPDPRFYSIYQGSEIFRLGKWARSREIMARTEGRDCRLYATGFHLFPTIEDAREYVKFIGRYALRVLMKVRWRGLKCKGVEYGWGVGQDYLDTSQTPDSKIPTIVVDEVWHEEIVEDGDGKPIGRKASRPCDLDDDQRPEGEGEVVEFDQEAGGSGACESAHAEVGELVPV